MKEITSGFVASDGVYFPSAFLCSQYENKVAIFDAVTQLLWAGRYATPVEGMKAAISHITKNYYLTPKEPTIG